MTVAASDAAIIQVMAGDFWRRGRTRIVAALLGLSCLNVLFYQLISRVMPISGDLPTEGKLNLFLAIFFVDMLLIVESTAGPALEVRDFLLPLPTWRLILKKMAFPVLAAAGLWMCVSLVTLSVTPSTVLPANWPLLGPALLSGVLVAWALAVL